MRKYNPFVIGITGSVGKTSTRHAIACALSFKYKLREPIRNYNNEFGIPLTIFNTEGMEETNSRLGWLRVFAKALLVWLLPQNYPELLVLEYGIDKPGDMDRLVNIVKPQLAIITTIGISHKEFFNSEEEIAHEKGKLAASLPANGTFVYNLDDTHVASQTSRTEAKKVSFGTVEAGNHPDILLEKVEENLSLNPTTTLYIKTPTRELKITIPVLGTAHVKAVLAAVAVAEVLDVDSEFITKGLANYKPVPGRLNVLAGIKKSILIDDSYNAAPLSMIEALKLLSRFPNPQRVAVLGDMLELGDETEKSHFEVGQLVANLSISKLITVGELGKKIATAAELAGMNKENIISFADSKEAASYVLQNLESDCVVLVKGSQGARMERISKELLAEPMTASQMLPRQYGKWLAN